MSFTAFPIQTLNADENEFPKVILVEQSSAPSNPSSGQQKLYIRTSDHHLVRKNSSGTVTDIEAASGDVVGPASAVDNRIAVFDGTTGKLLKDGGSTIADIVAGTLSYLNYQDQQAQNTQGGTFTSGAWRTRVLNTEVSDTGGYGSLSSNQITLTAGTYIIRASAPAWAVGRHQIRLQNVTDATTVLVGRQGFIDIGATGGVNISELTGKFTIGASKALELQHQCETTKSTNGFGIAANFTTEVYAVVELWKVG